jgi:hypothetical protein
MSKNLIQTKALFALAIDCNEWLCGPALPSMFLFWPEPRKCQPLSSFDPKKNPAFFKGWKSKKQII